MTKPHFGPMVVKRNFQRLGDSPPLPASPPEGGDLQQLRFLRVLEADEAREEVHGPDLIPLGELATERPDTEHNRGVSHLDRGAEFRDQPQHDQKSGRPQQPVARER